MLPQTTIDTALGRAPTALVEVGLSRLASDDSMPLARPLLVRFGAMGDMVMMTTMVRALAARYGTAVDILSSGPWTAPLLAGQPGVGDILLLRNRSLPYFLSTAKQALARQLRQRGPGPTWYCDTDGKCLDLMQRAGIGRDLICNARDLPMKPNEHLVDYWHRFAGTTPGCAGLEALPARMRPAMLRAGPGLETSGPETGGRETAGIAARHDPALLVSPEAAGDLERWLATHHLTGRPLLLVQPGNKKTMRRGPRRRPSNTKWWPEVRWAAVLRAVAQMHPQAAVLMLGVPREYDLNERIIALAGTPGIFNAARELPIPRLMALQSRAMGMISVDTGPAHCAAAVGCPLLVLFGAADPVRISPRGSAPVRVLVGTGADGTPMLGITVEQVLDQWQALPKREPLHRLPDSEAIETRRLDAESRAERHERRPPHRSNAGHGQAPV